MDLKQNIGKFAKKYFKMFPDRTIGEFEVNGRKVVAVNDNGVITVKYIDKGKELKWKI